MDLADLGATILLVETLERVLEEVRVRSKTRSFRDAVVVLTGGYDEKGDMDDNRM